MGDKTPSNTDKRLQNLREPWKPGESGNPNGRPKSVKNLINENFLRDLLNSWEKSGVKALEKLADKDVSSYVRIVAALVPKEFVINEGETALERILDEYSAEDLRGFMSALNEGELAQLDGKGRKAKGTGKQPDTIH